MGRSEIRVGQLISTFGPGALIVDRYGMSLIVCGLDHWFYREPEPGGERCETDKIEEFRFNEWRLEQNLQMDYFMRPPDFRIPEKMNEGDTQTPNVSLYIPTLRFPAFFHCSNSGCNRLRLAEHHLGKRPQCKDHDKFGRMNQVRFITVCPNGHIDEFPWREYIGCVPECDGKLTLIEQGGADLASIRVTCSCGKGENLGGVTAFETSDNGSLISTLTEKIQQKTGSDAAGLCRGRCLWHGPNHLEGCGQNIVATFPNATNVYHSRTWTSIFIPVRESSASEAKAIVDLLRGSTDHQTAAKTLWNINKQMCVDHVNQQLIEKNLDLFEDIEVAKSQTMQALEQFFSDVPVLQDDAAQPSEPHVESEETAFRRVEFNVLRKKADERDLLTTIVDVPSDLKTMISRVVQVERLRETRILYGFDRFMSRPVTGSAAEIGESALKQLFKNVPEQGKRWLPGSVVFGEGIYFELDEKRLKQWQSDQDTWIKERLIGDHNYAAQMPWSDLKVAPQGAVNMAWISRYLLVHTLSHIVVNQLVFECGYSTASLRERLYISNDPDAPMAGILIYTSAGDSEGTLGGLVRLAEPQRFIGTILRASQRASWCSADPVCSEVTNVHDYNLAACHSCVLLPETSCENFNKALDRAMVVGTPANPETGFFSELVDLSDRIAVS